MISHWALIPACPTDDSNRVKLKTIIGAQGSYYINASYLDVGYFSCHHLSLRDAYLFVVCSVYRNIHKYMVLKVSYLPH